jgi:hypothetical protein
MLVTKGIGTNDAMTMSKFKRLLPKLKSQQPEAIDPEQWTSLENSLENL